MGFANVLEVCTHNCGLLFTTRTLLTSSYSNDTHRNGKEVFAGKNSFFLRIVHNRVICL
jgi:hypothetical protein